MAAYNDAWWELLELVMAGAPDDIVKGYRSVLVPTKGPRAAKRLTAKEADAAIKGGKAARAGGESDVVWAQRQDWYVSKGLPVVAAHHWDDVANKRAAMLRSLYLTHPHTLLVWDAEGVDRSYWRPGA